MTLHLPFFRLPGLVHLNDARTALSLDALLHAIYTLWNAAQPAWWNLVSDASYRRLILDPVPVSNPVVVLVLPLHQRAAVLSLQSSSSASCCWPSWGVCSTSSTKRAKSVADPASKTCKCKESTWGWRVKLECVLTPLDPASIVMNNEYL